MGNPTTGLKIPLIIPTGVTSRKALPRRRKQECQFQLGTGSKGVPIPNPSMKLPNKKYNIIYADPPWKYNDRAKTQLADRGAEGKYNVMSVNEIANLPVKTITANDCVLFLWITFPFLNEFTKVIDKWGFEYKTVAFTWVKTNASDSSVVYTDKSFFKGMGNWTRSNAEICLLGTKGKPQRVSKGISQILVSHRGEHSAKPLVVRDKIVELCGDLPRIELFSRHVVDGWDNWGSETHIKGQKLLF